MELEPDFTFAFDNFAMELVPWFTPTSRLPNGMPDVDIKTVQLVRNHGAVVVSQRFTKKVIQVFGYILAPNRTAYEESMDELKFRLSGKQRPLSLIQAGKERRYTASLTAFGEGFIEGGKTYISLTFEAHDPFGRDISDVVYIESPITVAAKVLNHIFEGYADVRPKIQLTLAGLTGTGTRTVYVANSVTGQEIQITRVWANNDVLVVDCDAQSVTVNGIKIDFTGFFPTFAPRTGRIQVRDTFTTRTITPKLEYPRLYL